MEESKVLELLNRYIVSKDESDLSALQLSLEKANQEDEGSRSNIIRECELDFGKELWDHLDETNTKELIISSCADIVNEKRNHTNASSSFFNMALSMESELKTKIFNDFNSSIKDKIDSFTDPYDKEYVNGLKSKTGFVPVAQMLYKLKYLKNTGGIPEELRNYLSADWDISSLSNKKAIERAFELAAIRNNNGHGVTNFAYDDWPKVKQLAIKVLDWFIFSCLSFR